MSTLWIHSRQDIRDRPVSTAGLRRLADDGRLTPNDLVYRVGTDRWVPAGKIEGLFNAGHAEWYFTHDGRTYGPVTLQQLWDAAGQGFLTPDDYVIRAGMGRWKAARKVVGLFPEPAASGPPPPPLPGFEPRTESQGPLPPAYSPRRLEGPVAADVPAPPGGPARVPQPVPPAARGFAPAMYLAERIPSLLLTLALLCLAVVGSVWSMQTARTPEPRSRAGDEGDRPRRAPREMVEVTTDDLANEAEPARVPTEDPPAHGRAHLARLDLPPAHHPRVSRGEPMFPDHSLPLALVGSPGGRGPAAPIATRDPAASLSVDSERRLGQAMHNRILREHPVLETDGLREQIERILRPLLAACRRVEIDYSVTVIDDPDVFAFSHLGGYVYLSRGMLELAATEEGLRFAIAHELAHLELQHGWPVASRLVAEARLRGQGEASLAPKLLQLLAEQGEDDDELAADAWVVENLAPRGGPAAPFLAFPDRYLAYLRQHANDPRGPRDAAGSAPSPRDLDRHWNRAPSTIERLERFPSLVARVLPEPVSAAPVSSRLPDPR